METGSATEPYRLIGPDGAVVTAVSAWFADLQAAGRSPATLRSYGMDLLRWFRFLWAAGVEWNRATRDEARDFSRWLIITGQGPGKPYAASVRAHSETVLRSFYGFHLEAGTGPIVNPFPLVRPGSAGPIPITIRWSRTGTSGRGCIGRGCRRGSRAACRIRGVQRDFRPAAFAPG